VFTESFFYDIIQMKGDAHMKDRLVKIRKQIDIQKKISQSKFAGLLGTTRNAIASYESGKVVPSDTFIKLLCSKFNINEDWLRTGTGDMHIESDDSLFTIFSEKYGLTQTEQNVARYCLQLTSVQRTEILNHVLNIAEILKPTNLSNEHSSKEIVSNPITQELSNYKQELEAEERAQLVCENSDLKKNGTK
jgi:transcriptional regulator with XRE-family HTH domain